MKSSYANCLIYRMRSLVCLFIFILFSCSKGYLSQEDGEILESGTSNVLNQISQDIQSGLYGDIHSCIVWKDDDILLEEYFNWHRDSLHFQFSVTKSISALLIGIALDQGLIKSVDEDLLNFFPKFASKYTESKGEITLKHLLTMRAGYQWDEWSYPYTDIRNDANKLIRSPNIVQFMMEQPLEYEPGKVFEYNSGCSMLLGAVVENVSGMNVEEYARQYLFGPLGISQWRWEKTNDDSFNTSWGLHLKSSDMLKIGRLVLMNGIYESEQLISKKWLKESLLDHGNNYGLHWWLSEPEETVSARGWGGQFIFINQTKNLVLVTTAENFADNNNPAGFRILREILNTF